MKFVVLNLVAVLALQLGKFRVWLPIICTLDLEL